MESKDLIGKALLIKKDLEFVRNEGFEEIEIGLRKEDLENIHNIINLVESTGLKIISVHTPHCIVEDTDAFLKAAEVAKHFNALLVFHSNRIPITYTYKVFDKINYPKKAAESNPGISLTAIENCILKNNYDFVLDLAHLFIASDNLMEDIKYLFENYKNQIKLIHLSDSTLIEDGLPIGGGNINLKEVVKFLDENYKGKLVVEVMPEFQKGGREKTLDFLKRK
ncbi:MAG: sugar phosphate isomerase/epimerase [Candidatus Aenigmarchaeota archaeon]|nr:sugar phosphate isomerase/epimerase [Candidatus Aenigmarchaeota archaeon]